MRGTLLYASSQLPHRIAKAICLARQAFSYFTSNRQIWTVVKKTPKCRYCHQWAPIYNGQGNVQWAADDFPSPYLLGKCGVRPLYLSSTCYHSVSFVHLTSTDNRFCISRGTSTSGLNEWRCTAYGDTQHSPKGRASSLTLYWISSPY